MDNNNNIHALCIVQENISGGVSNISVLGYRVGAKIFIKSRAHTGKLTLNNFKLCVKNVLIRKFQN